MILIFNITSIILLPDVSISEDRYENLNDDSDSQINLSNNPPNKNQFNYYKELIIDHSKVSGLTPLNDFPFLISIYDSDLHENVQSSGNDIAFSDGITWLDHEMELFERDYNATHTKLVVWVRLPSLSTTVDTIIYLYYGNATMSPRENPTGVWDTNYKGVWHSSEDPTGTIYDSTSNNNDGTPQGSMGSADQVDGQIGGSLNFDGNDEYIDCGNPTELQITGSITVEAWCKADYFGNTYLVSKNGPSDQRCWDISFDEINLTHGYVIYRYALNGEGHADDVGNVTVAINQWYHVVGVFDASTYSRLFLNGQMVDENTTNILSSQYDAPNNLRFGARGDDPPPNYFDGTIDEVRISNIARSADWIKTEYDNQLDPNSFYSIGEENEISYVLSNAHYFTWYKEIIIDHTKVSGPDDLLNFPVLISCFDEDLHDKVQADGDDIAFSDSSSWLDHEIELFDQTYNSTHAQLVTWVRIPNLSSSEDTVIIMHYGNATMGSRENPVGVWDDTYEFVLHMNQDPSSSDILDSTSNGFDFDVEVSGSMTSDDLVTGQTGKALAFDGVDDYIYLPFSEGFSGPIDKMTFDFWIMFPDGWIPPASRNYLGIPAIASGDPYLSFYDNFEFHVETDSGYRLESTQTTFTSGTWYHISAVWDGTGAGLHRIYISGSLDKNDSTPPTGDHSMWNTFSIGGEDDDGNGPGGTGGDRELKATLSEFRLSKVVRSADWIATEYNNQYYPNSFYSIGKELTVSGNPPNAHYFKYYKEIIIDHTMVSGPDDYFNFPLLISCFDEDLHDKAQLDGDDIAFSDSSSWFDHEIEFFDQAYNSTHAELVAWVRIPRLSTSLNTILRMHYGNSTMSSRESPEDVWDSDYESVYHLNDDFLDATSHNRDGSNAGSVDAKGKMGDGQDFEHDDGSDNINIGTWSVSGSEITIQAWVKYESFDSDITGYSDGRVLAKNSGTSDVRDYNVWMLGTYNDSVDENGPYYLRGFMKTGTDDATGTSRAEAMSGNLEIEEWYLMTIKYDGSNIYLVLDGNTVLTQSKTGPLRENNWTIFIGNSPTGQRPIDGIIDEVRISSTIRSDNWLKTEYANQYDPNSFYSIGKEYTVSGNPPNQDYFTYYKEIRIAHSKVSGPDDLINFPLLISTFDGDLHDKVQENGDDIAFSYNGAWLDHELELFDQTYNSSHAQLIAWVRIPRLSTSLDTIIRIYYGNSTMTNRENKHGVWNSDYKGVYHLSEDPTGTTYDSTSNDKDGTPNGMESGDQKTGQIDGSLHFDGTTSEYDDIPYTNLGSSLTYSFWFKFLGGTGDSDSVLRFMGGLITFSDTWNYIRWYPDVYSSKTEISYNFPDTNWHYFTVFQSGTECSIYVDNVVKANEVSCSSIRTNHDYSDFGNGFDGYLDEVRISDVARSADWVLTEYDNQYDPTSFFTIGPEQKFETTPPTYSNLIESSDPLELGNTEVITINVSDPSGISKVEIEFMGSNHSMTNIGGDTWQYDTWTPSSVDNYTYTIWMEDNYNNLNSTIGTIEVIDTTSPTYSDLIESADPLQLGQNETITIKVYDSPGSGVNQTLLEYDFSNHTMAFAGGNTWSWDKWKPVSLGLHDYKIYMQDMENNWNMTSGTIMVVSTTAPVIENLTESENPLELGNNITIMVDIFDNESYVDVVFIELEGVNHTMTNTTIGNTYEFNWTRSYVGIVYYTIYANDSNNNWNSYSSSFDIVDTTPPSFSGITKSEDPLEFGDTVIISVNSTDLADINQVKIEFMGSNHSMTNISGYTWQYDSWIPTNVGNLTYTIWAEDKNNNWGFISDSILVQDTTPPVYSDLVESSSTVELGDLLIISINSTDLAEIKDVSIEFENSNHTMTNIGGDIWQYSWMSSSIGNYSYSIYITDYNDNLNSVTSSIVFQDTIIPVYSNIFESADPLELGDNQIIRIDIYDFAGINQSLIEFEGVNHSMTNIYGETWQLDSWTPDNWIVYQYRIHMEDNSGNWNDLTGYITVQDTTPPPSPVLTYSPSGDVKGKLVFDWLDGSDPSGISYYILIIDNETDPYATPGYVHIFNITNVGSNSSYLELPVILSVGNYYFFLAQIDGVGQQGSFTMGTFTVISTPGNNNLMIIVIIALVSVIGSVAAIVIVRKKLKKNITPPRKKISLKIISSHINKLSSSEFALQAEEFQAITSEGITSRQLTNERELENRINEIRAMGEELFADGAYLEAQEQFKLGRDLLLNLGREEEANLFSELIFGIEGLIEEREKRLEVLEETRVEGDSEQIFDLYQDIIDISKQLRDPDGVSYYQSELIQYFQINKLGVVDLETYRFNLNQKAESSFNNNVFKIAAQLYEKCEKISQLLVQLGRDEEIPKIEDFRYKRNECLKRIS